MLYYKPKINVHTKTRDGCPKSQLIFLEIKKISKFHGELDTKIKTNIGDSPMECKKLIMP